MNHISQALRAYAAYQKPLHTAAQNDPAIHPQTSRYMMHQDSSLSPAQDPAFADFAASNAPAAQSTPVMPATPTTSVSPVQAAAAPVEMHSSPSPVVPEQKPQVESSTGVQKHTVDQMKQAIYAMKDQLDSMLRMLSGEAVSPSPSSAIQAPQTETLVGDEEIIEGVFDGEQMIGQDGKSYPMSANYASKSKLVEGDLLKLTITKAGRLIYKQIGPLARKHIRGELVFDAASQKWSVLAEGKMYRILTASVTFHKGKSGDEVMLIIPESGGSTWGAVETIRSV